MLSLELDLASLTDSDDWNIFDSLYDPKIALGHDYSLPQFAKLTTLPSRTHSTYPLGIIIRTAFAHRVAASVRYPHNEHVLLLIHSRLSARLRPTEELARMPSVLVVPVYVEIPDGVERAVMALEAHLRRAGYIFQTGEPFPETLEKGETMPLEDGCASASADGQVGTRISP
jgi:hypothetical protein